jgi:hypothetical protein
MLLVQDLQNGVLLSVFPVVPHLMRQLKKTQKL